MWTPTLTYNSYCTNIPFSSWHYPQVSSFFPLLGKLRPWETKWFALVLHIKPEQRLASGLCSTPAAKARNHNSPRLLAAYFFSSSLFANYLGKQMLLHFFGANCALGGHADTFSMSLLKGLVSPFWGGALIKCTCAWTYKWFWEPESKIQWMLWTKASLVMNKEKGPAVWVCLRHLQNTRTVIPAIQDQDWKWLL